MKKSPVILLLLVCAQLLSAADASERGATLSPLKIYSGGVAIGVHPSLSEGLREESRSFLKLSFTNTFAVREYLELFCDIDWMLPKKNGGIDVGVDYLFLRRDFRPFIGIGAGGRYIDRKGNFGDNFGPVITAHAGITLDLTENVAVRIRMPYHVVFNESLDRMGGIDCALLFSSRFKKVQKLNYN
jgi:hypothetical protein